MSCLAGWLIASTVLGGVELRERPGGEPVSRVLITMNAVGELRPGAVGDGPAPKAVPVKVESRLGFAERLKGTVAVRRLNEAVVRIETASRPMTTRARPELALVIAERVENGARVYSPGGPFSRPELNLVQSPLDPLIVRELLPDRAVEVGDTWEISAATARALSDYDALASQTVRCEVKSIDDAVAVIHVGGEVRGAARGGEGTLKLEGSLTFDRRAGWVRQVSLERTEVRKPGPIEPGFSFKGTLALEREAIALPSELSDEAIAGLPLDAPAHLLLLQFAAPDGRYRLLHDRDWHLFWDDTRTAVLKRLDRGDLVAQCNLSVGPNAGKGRHQDPAQFREDIRRALGKRFVAFLGAGEIDNGADGGYRYRVTVQGKEGDQSVLWNYYLIAGPDGDQLLATFTCNAADQKRLGDQDLEMVGSLEWTNAAPGEVVTRP